MFIHKNKIVFKAMFPLPLNMEIIFRSASIKMFRVQHFT